MRLHKKLRSYIKENNDTKKDIVILSTIDGKLEALYVNNILNCEGSPLGKGDRLFLLKKAEDINFRSYDIRILTLGKEDNEVVEDTGFPKNIEDLEKDY